MPSKRIWVKKRMETVVKYLWSIFFAILCFQLGFYFASGSLTHFFSFALSKRPQECYTLPDTHVPLLGSRNTSIANLLDKQEQGIILAVRTCAHCMSQWGVSLSVTVSTDTIRQVNVKVRTGSQGSLSPASECSAWCPSHSLSVPFIGGLGITTICWADR